MNTNLQKELEKIAKLFRQDSIAWYECKFVKEIIGIQDADFTAEK
jgi:hypothetical protein